MDKIKELWSKFYGNKKLFWGVIGGVAALLVIVGVIIAVCAGGSAEAFNGCTVTVKSEGGLALEGISVSVYTDAAKAEMVTYTKTDKDGAAAITGEVPAGSVAVLEGVPAGYVTQESYPITAENTEIVLEIELLKEMGPITLGGVMFDFTVTDTDGVSHTLSELLKEKDAVVLNLWYTTCGPCQSEFPYLQQAYDLYGDKIALLALDPMEDDDEAGVAAFKTGNGLTFPMAKVDAAWEKQIEGVAYPTTIIIDRFGTVGLIHVGGIDNVGTFAGAFDYFTAEGYTQSTVSDITTLYKEVEVSGEGTKENPLEFAGLTEFEVTVEAGQTVYCNLYRVSGMELTVQSETLNILYGEQQYLPAEGTVTCLVNTPDPNTPALVAFTNTGTEAETYKVTMVAPEGSMDNPIALVPGDMTAQVAEGNYQGVFYTYTADKKGDFIVTVKKAPKDVKYGIVLNNLTATKYLTLDENGVKDDDGNMTLTVPVNKNDELQLIVTVLPDDAGAYPAADIELNAVLKEEEQDVTGGGTGSTTGGGSTGGGSTGGGSTGGGSGSSANYNGTVVNPDEPIEWAPLVDEPMKFDAEIGAGKLVKYNLYKVSGTTLCIYDADAYVIYNGKTYKPNSSGNVFVWVETRFMQSPIEVQIGNSSSSDKTFKVSFYYPKGSYMNPYDLTLDKDFTTEVEKGNDQGVFYTWTATKTGKLTLTLKSGNNADITVYNKSTYQKLVLSETEGATSVTIDVNKGDLIEVTIGTIPDENFKFPAATIVAKATVE